MTARKQESLNSEGSGTDHKRGKSGLSKAVHANVARFPGTPGSLDESCFTDQEIGQVNCTHARVRDGSAQGISELKSLHHMCLFKLLCYIVHAADESRATCVV